MAVYSKEHLFMLIVAFFAIYTAFCGLCNEASAGQITFSELSGLGFGNAVPGQITPAVGASSNAANTVTIIPYEDFTNSTQYNKSVLQINPGKYVFYNPWTQVDGIGYVLTGNALPYISYGEVGILGVQPTNGIYDVVYYINDTAAVPYNLDIAVPSTSSYAQVQITATTISIFEILPTSSPTIGLASGNQNYNYLTSISEIETIWNPTTGDFTINLNGGSTRGGSTMTTKMDPSIGNNKQFPDFVFAGVQSYQNGIVVQKIITQIQTTAAGTNIGTTGIPFIDAILQAGANLLSAMAQFAAMLAIFFGATSSSVVPLWLYAIFALPQIATLVYMGLELARGTG